jgi:diguanylate cyclase (GGDEF)-like protein
MSLLTCIEPSKLPSPPAVAIKILETIKKEDFNFNELSKIISADPSLCAKILKIANSSYYGLSQKINCLDKAISILGTEMITNLALSFVIVKGMNRKVSSYFDFDFFWRRSITCAVASDLFKKNLGIRKDSDGFVAGLLEDIGVLVLHYLNPDDYQKVFDNKRTDSLPIQEIEKKILSFDHQDVGAEVLHHWGLPESIYIPVSAHHNPFNLNGAFQEKALILNISDLVSSVYHGGSPSGKILNLKKLCQEQFSQDMDQIDEFIDLVADKTREILSFFEIDPGNMKPYCQILQEANEELKEMNLNYAQVVFELRRSQEKLKLLAKELKRANEQLRILSIRDGLTGLYNYRHFHDLLDKELSRAIRYKRLLSIIMLDIDWFKRINDTYGHPQGDEVLRVISKTIMSMCREADSACRYGGEEFSIIMPETDMRGAVIIAEKLRKQIETTPIRLNQSLVNITISLGITTYVPELGRVSKENLINAADYALYQSKKLGRNRISVKPL